jgi:putative DNA primase/helicase
MDNPAQDGNQMSNKIDGAIALAKRGWHVFPTHSTDEAGVCTCGNPECGSAGKHPRTPSGLKDATTDPDTIRSWWGRWPDANIAVRTGAESGLFVLDTDVKNGAKGYESLNQLEVEFGVLPATLTARTWSGGSHHFFRHPGDSVKNRTGFRPGLDIRGDGGYVLVAPSFIGDENYTWVDHNAPVVDAPHWLLEVIADKESRHKTNDFNSLVALKGFAEGKRNDGVFRYACRLRHKDYQYDDAKILVLKVASECSPPLPSDEAIRCLDSAYKYNPGTRRPLTELGNAERLVDHHGEDIRFIPEYGNWIHWDYESWVLDSLFKINQLAKDVIRGISQEAAEEKNTDLRSAITKHAKESEKKNAIDHMIQLTASEFGISIHAHMLDMNPWLFGVRNGVVELRTGAVRPAAREDYITKLGHVDHAPCAQCPTWQRFLLQIMGEDQELVSYLQMAVGYTLTGITREQAVFILHGTGANGKSTFIEVLEQIMGDYSRSVASETLMAQRGRSSSGPTEDIARLKGARLAATCETEEGQVLAEALLKRMTGEDTLVARLPYAKNSMEFKPQFKVWVAANHRPIVRGDDHAIWRRIHLIPFDQTFEGKAEDKFLKQKLIAELPGILNWAIEGCLLWQKQGLVLPAQIREATLDYRDDMDLLAEWIESCCILRSDQKCSTSGLFNSYQGWCMANSVGPLDRRVFGRKLVSKGFTRVKSGGSRGYLGIGLYQQSKQYPHSVAS